jgi:hypothetical protein
MISMMRALIYRTVELLKKRVRENLDRINQNQAEIKELLNQPLSAERTYYIEKYYDLNKALLTENNDYINLQLTLLNFIQKYKDSPALEEIDLPDLNSESYLDENEIFDLTIQGKLSFDLSHPKFGDEAFFHKLLGYFTATENYEKCNDLLNLKKELRN